MRDPKSMTPDDRRDEVASILARGMARTVLQARASASSASGNLEKHGETCLELPDDQGLSVAPRPAG